MTFISLWFFSFYIFSTPLVDRRPAWFWDNHRLPGTAGSLHEPLSCKCHSVSDYDLCQLSSSLWREGHGPLVYRRRTRTQFLSRAHALLHTNIQAHIHSHTCTLTNTRIWTQTGQSSDGMRGRTFWKHDQKICLFFLFKHTICVHVMCWAKHANICIL